MRLQSALLTIPVGQNVSNPIDIDSDRFIGLRVVNRSDASAIRFQALVDGNINDPVASQTWLDIRVTTTEAPPTAPYSAEFLAVALPAVVSSLILLPRHFAGYPLAVIRVQNTLTGTPTNITGTDATFRLITDSLEA